MTDTAGSTRLNRRGFLRSAGALVASSAAAAACGSAQSGTPTIRIGFVTPVTGSLALFGEADDFVISAVQQHFAQHPIVVGGVPHAVEIVKRDSQSNIQRASDVAGDLVQNGGIHLMLVSSTPDTTNPVSDQCELAGMPCVSTLTPWQPWYFGRGAKAGDRFEWTFDFCFGLDDDEAMQADLWDSVPTNKIAACLWPNDPDGLAWSDPQSGFPSSSQKRGYTIVDPGNYEPGTQDYSAQIELFKQRRAEVLMGVPVPPDFAAFWKQAVEQGFRPKIANISKAILFPSSIEAIGDIGINLCSEVSWSPAYPYSSSLTGQTARQLADAYSAATTKQWIQPLGFSHALWEVAAQAFSSVPAIDDRKALASAISTMRIDTIVGPLDWSRGPVPGVATTPLVGGQWRKGTTYPYELVIVTNKRFPAIPVGGTVQPLFS